MQSARGGDRFHGRSTGPRSSQRVLARAACARTSRGVRSRHIRTSERSALDRDKPAAAPHVRRRHRRTCASHIVNRARHRRRRGPARPTPSHFSNSHYGPATRSWLNPHRTRAPANPRSRTTRPFCALRASPRIIRRTSCFGSARRGCRALGRYLDNCREHVGVVEQGTWIDPQRLTNRLLHGDGSHLCNKLLERVEDRGSTEWLRSWAAADGTVAIVWGDLFESGDDLTEPRTALELAAVLPSGSNLVVGSSMPVRDLDAVMEPRTGLDIYGNRGANGIDGFVSTALGIAIASKKPTAALCGDLTMLHDQNGLLAAAT